MCKNHRECNLPYYADGTTSRPICEVKQRQARVVLRWETTGEVRVQIIFVIVKKKKKKICNNFQIRTRLLGFDQNYSQLLRLNRKFGDNIEFS